jgi:hypothetical protein
VSQRPHWTSRDSLQVGAPGCAEFSSSMGCCKDAALSCHTPGLEHGPRDFYSTQQ